MHKMTVHTRKTRRGYTAYVQVQDGPRRRTEWTRITRTTRQDARHDAEWLRDEVLRQNPQPETTP